MSACLSVDLRFFDGGDSVPLDFFEGVVVVAWPPFCASARLDKERVLAVSIAAARAELEMRSTGIGVGERSIG